jgi:hypothetical protein
MSNASPVVKFRSRSEGRILRPFANLDAIQQCFDDLSITVNYQFGEEVIQLGGSLELPARYLADVGIRINGSSEFHEALMSCLKRAELNASDLRLAVIAHDSGRSPLRESELVSILPMDSLSEPQQLIARESTRGRPMRNGFDGYVLEAQIVLNQALELAPLRPSLRGTIIASGVFRFATNDISSSLQPRPLTNLVRKEKELPNDSWFFVEIHEEIIDTLALGEVVQVWVDDEYLRKTSLMTSAERTMSEHIFIVSTMTTLVYEASKDLKDRQSRGEQFEFDGTNSALLKLLFTRSKKYLGQISVGDFAVKLREQPQLILAYCLSAGSMKTVLQNSAEQIMGDTDAAQA